MTIGKRISQLRKKKGYTQEYIADQLGVSRQAVSKWEQDQTSPDTKNLIALSELLEVPIEYIATGKQSNQGAINEQITKTMHIIGIILLCVSALLSAVGIFSGEYTDMVFVGNVGIWFLWYGKSPIAIGLVISSGISFLLSLVCHIIGFIQRKEK